MAGIDQNTLWQLASMILGKSKAQPTTRERATFLRTDSDGTQWVRLPSSNDETPVNGRTLATAKAGDTVEWSIDNGRLSITGNSTSPSVGSDYVGQEVSVVTKRVDAVKADIIETNELLATKATITELEAESARIDTIEADVADIDTIRANSAKVQNLTAAQLEADHAKVSQLDVSQIEADHATIGNLDTTYMHANMSNSDVAWIQNGTIKDGAITNAMINSVSANKLTAGTIDASQITVTNLNAGNITAGTINGQRIGQGSLSLDKLSESVYTEAEVDTIVDGLNDRIDGAIETHTGTAVPTLNNQPASSWNTTALKDEHVGDVYYVVNSQSQQNGYCYRFTKSGSTYSWQLIKDSDVTAALSRLTTAEGKITTFDSDISTLKTTTGTLTTKTESLETRMSDAESDILDKVDTTTFNEVSDTVDQHSQTISQHTTAISNKADSSTVTAVTNRVSKNEQDISGINTTIGELQETVESKADGSTVSTISNKLNTVSDTVDGHTQTLTSVQNTLSTKADSSTVSTLTTQVNNVSDTVDGHTSQLSSITTTQTTIQSTLDKTVKSSIQLWYSKANTTAPSKPTSQVTSTSTSGNAWRIVVPAYNASYPNYYYCWQYEYVDGTYGWSAVVRDIAMGESQATANSASTTATNAQNTANSNIKSSVQLWFTKANSTAPNKPTSVVSTSNANTANAWNLVVPVWNSSYPHYFYCYQQQKGDGTYQWTDVVYDRATSEAQQLANTTSTNLTALQEDYATYKQTTTENVSSIGTRLTTAEGKISTAETNISQNAQNIELKVSKEEFENLEIGGRNLLQKSAASAENLPRVSNNATFVTEDGYPCYKASGSSTVGRFYGYGNVIAPILEANTTYTYSSWIKVTTTASGVTSVVHTFTSLGHHQVYNANSTASDKSHEDIASKRVYTPSTVSIGEWTYITDQFTTNSLDGSIFGKYVKVALGSDYTVYVRDMKLEKGNKATDWTPAPEDIETRVSSAESAITQNANNIALKVSESDVTGNYLIGKINLNSTTASIAAQRINLQGAVTISDLSSDAQSATLNSNISVGGRNLALDSQYFSHNATANDTYVGVWYLPVAQRVFVSRSEGFVALAIKQNQNWAGPAVYMDSLGLAVGDLVAFSCLYEYQGCNANLHFYAMSTNSSGTRIYPTFDLLGSNGYDGNYHSVTQLATISSTNKSGKVWVVAKWSQAAQDTIDAGGHVCFTFQLNGTTEVTSGGSVHLYATKLEKGNTATDWTPAPEDVDSAISNAAKTATSYVTDITGGGIMVHPSGDQTTGVKVTDDVDILRNGTSVINVGENDAIRIGADGSVQMLLESDSLGISNEAGSEIFAIDSGSTGSVTIALDATLVTWNATADVGTTAYTVSDAGAAAGDAVVTATVNGTEYQLDSTYATATVTAGTGVSVALTSAGVTYVRGLMVETVEDDGSTVTTTYPCELTVEYQHAVTDVALLSLIGSQDIDGEGESLRITNSEWVANSRQSGTLMRLHNATTGRGLKLGVGSNGYTRGVFDSRNGDWIIARNRDDKTVINGTNFSVSPGGNVNASGTVASWYQVSARGNGSTSATRRVIALRSNSVGNRGLYDVSLDEWILYKNSGGSLAIGASTSDHLHRHESTCTVTTANATVTGGTNHCWHNNAVCTVLIGVNLKSSLANNSTVAIATAPANFRPPYTVVGSVYVTGQAVNLQAWIDSAGKITVNNRSGSTITTSANIYISFTFAL